MEVEEVATLFSLKQYILVVCYLFPKPKLHTFAVSNLTPYKRRLSPMVGLMKWDHCI